MQVTVESTGALKRTMKVVISEEQISEEIQKRLQSMSKRTKIDGFRRGKVPFKVIENHYGKQVRQEVLGEVLQSSYQEALNQEKLTPACQPKIEPLNMEESNGLSYQAIFEIMPEVKLANMKKIKIDKIECEITEDDYINTVDILRNQHKTYEKVERESQHGDTIDIDFEGIMNGEVFEGGSAKDVKLELGKNQFIDGFESGLTGKKAGEEVSLELKFPDNYQQKNLAGKPVIFSVSVKEVMTSILPEINQEFFKKIGIEEGGEEAFKEHIHGHMKQEVDTAISSHMREAVMDKLYEIHTLELPESLVHEEIHRLQDQFKDKLKAYGLDQKSSQEIPTDHEAFRKEAQKRVALQFIVSEIIKKESLKADPEKVRELVVKQSSNFEDPEMVTNWYYQEKERLAQIEAIILESEVVDWVSKGATLKTIKVKFDDLMNKGQTST